VNPHITTAVTPSPTKKDVQHACAWAFENHLLEEIYDPLTGRAQFVSLTKGGQPEVVDSFPLPGKSTLLQPLNNGLVLKGRVVLPRERRPYASEEALLEEIRAHISRYVVLPEGMDRVVAAFVLFTWLHDRFETVPYLRFEGDLGTGKSRALKVVGGLCYHAFIGAGSASFAAVFRGLEMVGGATLVLDETDFDPRRDEHQDMMTMLRQGFQAGTGVLRAEPGLNGVYEPRDYDVFGPKLLAGRKDLRDPALKSRCIRIYMQSGVPRGNFPAELPEACEQEAADLRDRLLQWRLDHYWTVLPEPEDLDVEPRLLQLYRPLAKVIHDEKTRGQLASIFLNLQADLSEDRRESFEGRVAAALADVFAERGEVPVLAKDIAAGVAKSSAKAAPATSKAVLSVCRGFGLGDRKTKAGRVVELNQSVLARVLPTYSVELPAPEPDANSQAA